MHTTDSIAGKKFSLRARCRSLFHAFHGLKSFFTSEHNALIHLLASATLVFLVFIFPVTWMEGIILVISTASVWAAELFNTAIEKTMDIISTEKSPSVKFIKDVSAAAVLVTAIAALAAGCIIFIPKFSLLW
jgi:diacylglycerol kinase